MTLTCFESNETWYTGRTSLPIVRDIMQNICIFRHRQL